MKLAYREYGSGQPMIILHGLFGQSDNWNTLAKQFAEKGMQVFTVDQRNHGLSPHSDDWSYNDMADDLMAFIEEHKLQKPVLLGHSMGGKTVLFFEQKYPGIAEKLIVADIASRAYEPHHQTVLEALHAVNFSVLKTRKEAEAVMNDYLSDFGTKQFLLKNIYWKENSPGEMAWRFNLAVITEKYENIGVAVPFYATSVKTLIVRGEKSNYVNAHDIEEFHNRFSNLSEVVIPGAGHWVHAEKPMEFFSAVISFIEG